MEFYINNGIFIDLIFKDLIYKMLFLFDYSHIRIILILQ